MQKKRVQRKVPWKSSLYKKYKSPYLKQQGIPSFKDHSAIACSIGATRPCHARLKKCTRRNMHERHIKAIACVIHNPSSANHKCFDKSIFVFSSPFDLSSPFLTFSIAGFLVV